MDSERMYLTEMGLSKYRADVYLTLLQEGTSIASEIASAADIPQSRVYDVLDALETRGFVKSQPGRPKKFGPIPPETAIDQYCLHKKQKQTNEREEIRELGEEFAETIDQYPQKQHANEVDISWAHPNRHNILEKLEQLTEQSNSEINMVTTPKSFERILNHHGSLLEKKVDNKVDVQAIVSNNRDINQSVKNHAEEFINISRVDDISGRVYLYDQKEILLAYKTTNDEDYVGVSTSSKHLYQTLEHMFKLLWNEGKSDLVPNKASSTSSF